MLKYIFLVAIIVIACLSQRSEVRTRSCEELFNPVSDRWISLTTANDSRRNMMTRDASASAQASPPLQTRHNRPWSVSRTS